MQFNWELPTAAQESGLQINALCLWVLKRRGFVTKRAGKLKVEVIRDLGFYNFINFWKYIKIFSVDG